MLKYFYKLFKEYKQTESYIDVANTKFNVYNNLDFNFIVNGMTWSQSIIIGNDHIKATQITYYESTDPNGLSLLSSEMVPSLYVNEKQIKTYKPLIKELYNSLSRQSDRTEDIIKLIKSQHSIIYKLSRKELLERMEEFEVIKDGEFDVISLHRLFDLYDITLNEKHFMRNYNRISRKW